MFYSVLYLLASSRNGNMTLHICIYLKFRCEIKFRCRFRVVCGVTHLQAIYFPILHHSIPAVLVKT